MAQAVKNLSAKQEIQVPSLSLEDPLEKGMATHSSILTWEIPWTEEAGGLQSMESQRAGHDLGTKQQQLIYLSLFWLCWGFPLVVESNLLIVVASLVEQTLGHAGFSSCGS